MLTHTMILIIFGLFLALQCILAINMRRDLKRWGIKHNFQLSSRMSVVDMLAKFSTLHQPINIKVNLDFNVPAVMLGNALAVSKSFAHQQDFLNCFTTLHILVGNLGGFYAWANLMTALQKLFYVLQFVFLGVSLLWLPELAFLAIGLAMLAIIVTVMIELRAEELNQQVLHYATDLLDLDKTEQVQAVKVANAFAGEGYWYVTFPWVSLLKFFSPRK